MSAMTAARPAASAGTCRLFLKSRPTCPDLAPVLTVLRKLNPTCIRTRPWISSGPPSLGPPRLPLIRIPTRKKQKTIDCTLFVEYHSTGIERTVAPLAQKTPRSDLASGPCSGDEQGAQKRGYYTRSAGHRPRRPCRRPRAPRPRRGLPGPGSGTRRRRRPTRPARPQRQPILSGNSAHARGSPA